LRKKNTFNSDWSKAEEIQPLVQAYLQAIKCFFKEELFRQAEGHHSDASLVQCRKCDIVFITSKSNQNRTDMLCPLGCRDHYQKETSNLRSTDYYRTTEGRQKKKALNRERSTNTESQMEDIKDSVKPTVLSCRHKYYIWLIYIIDGIHLSQDELHRLLERLQKKVRQRGPVKKSSTCYFSDD